MKAPIYLPLDEYVRVLARYLAAERECNAGCWTDLSLFGGLRFERAQVCHHPKVAEREIDGEWSFVATGRMGIVVIAADPDLAYAIDEHGCFLEAGA